LASFSQLALSSGVVAAIWPRICKADPEVGPPEGGVGVVAQRRGGFGDRPRLALDLGLQLDGRIGQFVALERLVRGACRRQAKRQRGANHCGANQTDHDGLLAADISRVTSKNARKGDGLMTVESACEKVACMALAVQTVPAAPPGGVPAAGFMSGADHRQWPAVCLSRELRKSVRPSWREADFSYWQC
jgi:hypothetical protein